MLVTNLSEQTEMLTDIKSLQRKRRVNGEYSLSFLLMKTERNEHSYPLAVEESLLEYEGQQYRIKKMDEKPVGLAAVKNILADHIFFDLIDGYQYDLLTGYLSIYEALTHAITNADGTDGFTWEVNGTFPQLQFENFGDDNPLALVQIILDRYGAEVEIDNKHLIFRNQIGRKTDFQFRFKHNLKTISKSVDSSNLSTYIKGYGANGIVAEYTSPMAAIYGIRHAKPVRDERYTTHEGLLERLKQEIQDEPKISFTIDFVDLRDQGFPYDRPQIGDEVYVIYEPLGIDITARILEIDEQKDAHGNIVKTNVTLANFKNSATDILSSFSRTQKQVDGILQGKEKLPFSALDAAVQRATNIIKNTESEIEYPESGWLIFRDKQDTNKIVALNSSGLAISSNNLVDVLTAITGDGIVADAITVGTLNAALIEIINNNGLYLDSSGLHVLDTQNKIRAVLGEYAPGKYGLKLTGGEIYSTTIQTGEEGATTFIRLTQDGNFEAVKDGKRTVFIQSSAAEGRIALYNGDGVQQLTIFATFQIGSKEYATLLADSSSGGINIQTSSGKSIRLDNDDIHIDCGSTGTLYVNAKELNVNGDLYVGGTIWNS